MSFDLINGYQPRTFAEILTAFTAAINTEFGTSYDETTIIGTEFYRYFYAGSQVIMQSEGYTAEITTKMTDYISSSNEKLRLPRSTVDGFIEGLRETVANGGLLLDSTMKDVSISDEPGEMFLVVDVPDGVKATGNATITDYANLVSGTPDDISINGLPFVAQSGVATPGDATFRAQGNNNDTATSLAIQINAHPIVSTFVTAVSDSAVVNLEAVEGGISGNSILLSYTDNDANVGATVSGANLSGGLDNENHQGIIDRQAAWLTGGLHYNGIKTGTKAAINGQVFNYAYDLPSLVDILVRVTVTASPNSSTPVLNENQIRDIFDVNFAALYRLGLDFEPEKYLEIARDLPFAANILLEYSEDSGVTWFNDPRPMLYDEKINITAPATIIVI